MSGALSENEFFRQITHQTTITLGLGRDYEHEQLEHFGAELREAERFLDIGANRGLYARLANRVLRNTYIGVVEANPELAETLQRDVATWPSENHNTIEVLRVAAGDVSTKLPFFMDQADELGTLTATPSREDDPRYVEVQCEPLDKIFAPAKKTLIKIDVEGFEYRVVLGARRLLSTDARVILELHGWGDGKKFPVHVIWLMFTLGFSISRIGTSYSYAFVKAGFLKRSLTLLRWGPIFAGKYLIRRMGLRSFLYRTLWPDRADRAGK